MLEDKTTHCNRCNQEVAYVYSLYLKTIITTENKQIIHCSIDKCIVEQLLPSLKDTKVEDYTQDKSKFIFILRDFTMKGQFTLNQNNAINHVVTNGD